MVFLSILWGGLQIMLLLSLTGVLVSLAALSRLMELSFMIIQPTVLFMLRQSVKYILFWITLSLQQTSKVLREMRLTRSSDEENITIRTSVVTIGTEPIRVPYAIDNCAPEFCEEPLIAAGTAIIIAEISRGSSLGSIANIESSEEKIPSIDEDHAGNTSTRNGGSSSKIHDDTSRTED